MMLAKFFSQSEQIKYLKKDIQSSYFGSPSTIEDKKIVVENWVSLLGNSFRGIITATHIMHNYSIYFKPFTLPESNISYTPTLVE